MYQCSMIIVPPAVQLYGHTMFKAILSQQNQLSCLYCWIASESISYSVFDPHLTPIIGRDGNPLSVNRTTVKHEP